MEDELFIFGKDIFEIGAGGIHPEFQHAARAVEAAGDEACALAFPRVTQINDLDGRIICQCNGIGSCDFLDTGTGVCDHFSGGDFESHGMFL